MTHRMCVTAALASKITGITFRRVPGEHYTACARTLTFPRPRRTQAQLPDNTPQAGSGNEPDTASKECTHLVPESEVRFLPSRKRRDPGTRSVANSSQILASFRTNH